MMPMIEVQGLGKSYAMLQPGEKWSGDFADIAADALHRLMHGQLFRRRKHEIFWALKDLSFSVQPGEVVALAGHNGAGKSTLLKVLSRITSPNEGSALIRGRIGSLLEVGTGFHPDLTGRENVYLAGTILGMRRQEVAARFDEIVAFAEMEAFIDTKVKRYSSGMYLRLAFSVAAHLSTEVLLVDEALAVGDVNFQRKCMGKMGQIAGQGRTVFFVSHSVSAMRTLCTRGILLDHGRQVMDGDIETIVQAYLAHGAKVSDLGNEWTNVTDNFRNPFFQPLSLRLFDEDAPGTPSFQYGSRIVAEIEGKIETSAPDLNIGLVVSTPEGTEVFRTFLRDTPALVETRLEPGNHSFRVGLPCRILNEGDYRIEIIALHKQWILEPGKGNPSLPLAIHGGFGTTPYWIQRRPGTIAPELGWSIQPS